MKKLKKGISLIVLVITIIVMIILATVIIISLNNAGVINSANKAVDDTNNSSNKIIGAIAETAYKYHSGEIKVGDYVEYNPTKNGATTITKSYTSKYGKNLHADQTFSNNYTGKWQVIGITEEGNLKLISSDYVDSNYMYFKCSSTGNSYLSASSELNNICSIYGYGSGALNARCIIMEDVFGKKLEIPEQQVY